MLLQLRLQKTAAVRWRAAKPVLPMWMQQQAQRRVWPLKTTTQPSHGETAGNNLSFFCLSTSPFSLSPPGLVPPSLSASLFLRSSLGFSSLFYCLLPSFCFGFCPLSLHSLCYFIPSVFPDCDSTDLRNLQACPLLCLIACSTHHAIATTRSTTRAGAMENTCRTRRWRRPLTTLTCCQSGWKL